MTHNPNIVQAAQLGGCGEMNLGAVNLAS